MEGTRGNLLIVLIVIGIILAGVAFYLRTQAQKPPEPNYPGYSPAPLKGKGSQGLGGGAPQ